jgi:diamine N-acetyltransferase
MIESDSGGRAAKNIARVQISQLAASDIDRLCALAGEIWRRHYANIISSAQIEYMLAQRFTARVLREELQRGDIWWDQLLVDGRMTGFSSYVLAGYSGEMKLDKLYVHHAHQRKGYGAMLLDRVVTIARAYGCETLKLTVNKHNRIAIAAYKKYGFRIADSITKDIGGGFVMDDYVMVRSM